MVIIQRRRFLTKSRHQSELYNHLVLGKKPTQYVQELTIQHQQIAEVVHQASPSPEVIEIESENNAVDIEPGNIRVDLIESGDNDPSYE